MRRHTTDFLKTYYYTVIHWQISMYIFQIKKESYPLDYWKNQLIQSLKRRNEYVFLIKNNFEEKQLQLF